MTSVSGRNWIILLIYEISPLMSEYQWSTPMRCGLCLVIVTVVRGTKRPMRGPECDPWPMRGSLGCNGIMMMAPHSALSDELSPWKLPRPNQGQGGSAETQSLCFEYSTQIKWEMVIKPILLSNFKAVGQFEEVLGPPMSKFRPPDQYLTFP